MDLNQNIIMILLMMITVVVVCTLMLIAWWYRAEAYRNRVYFVLRHELKVHVKNDALIDCLYARHFTVYETALNVKQTWLSGRGNNNPGDSHAR